MKRFKPYGFIAMMTLVFGLFSTAAFSKVTTAVEGPASNGKGGFLFTQTAASATFSPGKKAGWYTLTLNELKPMIWFKDKPSMKSGTITSKNFIKEWNSPKAESFLNDNPNANLVAFSSKKGYNGEKIMVIRLAQPSYDKETNSMKYQAQFISEEGASLYGKETFYDVALFIDNAIACGSCFGL